MLKYSINLIFLYAFPSAAPEFLQESGSLLVRSMNELAWKWNTSFELWLVFIAKMVIYSYIWTAASFFMHATYVLSRELFLCANSSDTVCEIGFFPPAWKGKRLFGGKPLVFHFRREEGKEGALRGTERGWGRRAASACCRREGGSSCPPGPGTSQLYKILYKTFFIDFLILAVNLLTTSIIMAYMNIARVPVTL